MDFEVTNTDESNKDLITYFALFSYCDLVAFENAIRELKWWKTMDIEVATIYWKKQHLGVDGAFKRVKDHWCEMGVQDKTKGELWSYKHKVHLVAEGYKQEFSTGYKKVFCSYSKIWHNQIGDCTNIMTFLAYLSIRHEIDIPTWRFGRTNIYWSTSWLCETWKWA